MATQTNFSHVEPDLLETAKYLRSKESELNNRDGVVNGRRVAYFKGKNAVKSLTSEKYSKNSKRRTITSQQEAEDVLQDLLAARMIVRVERTAPKSRHLQPSTVQSWNSDENYVWVYEGSQIWSMVIGAGVIGIVLAGVMFPLWPVQLRIGVWYLSMSLLGLLGLFFIMTIVRMFLAVGSSLYYGNKTFWLFPNLFEDVGILDSFKPTTSWEYKKAKKRRVSDVKEVEGENPEKSE